MKIYIAPEINEIKFDPNDIVAVTGSGDYMDYNKDGVSVSAADYFIG